MDAEIAEAPPQAKTYTWSQVVLQSELSQKISHLTLLACMQSTVQHNALVEPLTREIVRLQHAMQGLGRLPHIDVYECCRFTLSMPTADRGMITASIETEPPTPKHIYGIVILALDKQGYIETTLSASAISTARPELAELA